MTKDQQDLIRSAHRRPEVHDEFGAGAQGCLHVCGQVFWLD